MNEQYLKSDSLLSIGYMRVLLVEDDKRIVDFVQRGLKAEGYAVEVAGSGLEAIALGTEGEFQVIILDLGLPDFNGRQVCERLRDNSSGLTTIGPGLKAIFAKILLKHY